LEGLSLGYCLEVFLKTTESFSFVEKNTSTMFFLLTWEDLFKDKAFLSKKFYGFFELGGCGWGFCGLPTLYYEFYDALPHNF